MKRPTVFGGIGFAFAMVVLAVPAWWGLAAVLPSSLAFRLMAVGSYLAYCIYLLRTARTRVGTLSLITVNLFIGLGVFFLPLRIPALVAGLAAVISLNRSLLFHRSLVALGLDGLICFAGLTFSGYLLAGSGSIPAALWSFFLLQSVFSLIPARVTDRSGALAGNGREVDPFLHGQRQAEAALERIVGEI